MKKILLPKLFFLIISISIAREYHRDISVHDPVMMKEGDTYYLFATGRGISVWSSPDINNWKKEESVFASAPWVQEVIPDFKNHIWAPDISFHQGKYFLYYSVSSFGKNTSAIGVTTNLKLDPQSPDYKWEDHGIVVRSVPGRDLNLSRLRGSQ